MNREEKSATIQEIAAQIEESEAIFAVDYRGISVPQAAELRAKLRESDASFRVVKNRLTKLAADKAGESRLPEFLQGPTALTFVRGDTAGAAKAISTFNREHDVVAFKGGFMGELVLDEDQFKSIARLPSREILDGQLAGLVASPLTGLVRGLGSLISGLALQLGQIAEQGLVTAEAPKESSSEESAKEAPAEASDEVAEDADQGSQGDDATAAAPGSEAEEAAVDGEAPPSADDDPSLTSSEEAEGPADTAESPAEDSEADAETSDDAPETSETDQKEEE
jgi:large subunit ribosomal protein L10